MSASAGILRSRCSFQAMLIVSGRFLARCRKRARPWMKRGKAALTPIAGDFSRGNVTITTLSCLLVSICSIGRYAGGSG